MGLAATFTAVPTLGLQFGGPCQKQQSRPEGQNQRFHGLILL
jgi:hypothetical protein